MPKLIDVIQVSALTAVAIIYVVIIGAVAIGLFNAIGEWL